MVAAVVLATAPAYSGEAGKKAHDEALKEELAKLQGKWEMTLKVRGRTVRSVKVIEGNKTVLTRYDENGTLFWAHRSEFKLEITDRVKIFTFFNLEVTAGPQKGGKSKKPVSYIYAVDEDTWAEAMGLLIDQKDNELHLRIWKRVREKVAVRPTISAPSG